MDKEKLHEVFEYIHVSCIATCPICEQDFDADNDDDTVLVEEHIRTDHSDEDVNEFIQTNT